MKKDLNWIKQLQMKIIGYKSETHLERGKQKKGRKRGERNRDRESQGVVGSWAWWYQSAIPTLREGRQGYRAQG